MKNPFAHRGVTPALLFLQACLVLAFGIVSIANSSFAFSALQWVAAGSLCIAGVSRAWGLLAEKRRLQGGLTLFFFLGAATSMLLYPLFVASSAGRLFGLWFVINGVAHGSICVQCLVQKLRGKVRYGFSALFSLVFGLLLFVQPNLQLQTVFLLAGIYLILYAFSILVDACSEILLFGTAGAKVKTKVKIALPLFLTALLPGKLLEDFNQYFKVNPKEAARLLTPANTTPGEKTPLEVFIHLSDKGTQRTGHVDLRYLDQVYSYGCYDHHASRLGGLVSDGTMAICESRKYIAYCIQREEKILVGFGLALTPPQCKAIERELQKIGALLIPWESDYQRGVADESNLDAASQITKEIGAKIYKLSKGVFRRYYALNTNCVKLAEQVIGGSGLGLLNVNGILVPGSYYAMLNELYERGDALVTERNIYKETEKTREGNHTHATTSYDSTRKN